jgi:hypothetical protein
MTSNQALATIKYPSKPKINSNSCWNVDDALPGQGSATSRRRRFGDRRRCAVILRPGAVTILEAEHGRGCVSTRVLPETGGRNLNKDGSHYARVSASLAAQPD